MAKIFMGVVHLAALPSAAGYAGDLDAVFEAGLADARALAEGGVDAIMVENFGDRPFRKGNADDPVSPDVPAALAVAARDIRLITGLPVGINCLRNDAVAALAAAKVAAAQWVRINVLSGSFNTDQGLIEGEAARVLAFKQQIDCRSEILADLLVKHATPLTPIDAKTAALDLAERSSADALILTGARTGSPVDQEFFAEIRQVLDDFPLWIGSGLNVENASQFWRDCEGVIVGSSLKEDGEVTRPVDPKRVRAMRQALSGC